MISMFFFSLAASVLRPRRVYQLYILRVDNIHSSNVFRVKSSLTPVEFFFKKKENSKNIFDSASLKLFYLFLLYFTHNNM